LSGSNLRQKSITINENVIEGRSSGVAGVQELQNTDKLGCEGFGQGACGNRKQKTENRIQYSSVWSP
jgi:hypothetical protein